MYFICIIYFVIVRVTSLKLNLCVHNIKCTIAIILHGFHLYMEIICINAYDVYCLWAHTISLMLFCHCVRNKLISKINPQQALLLRSSNMCYQLELTLRYSDKDWEGQQRRPVNFPGETTLDFPLEIRVGRRWIFRGKFWSVSLHWCRV